MNAGKSNATTKHFTFIIVALNLSFHLNYVPECLTFIYLQKKPINNCKPVVEFRWIRWSFFDFFTAATNQSIWWKKMRSERQTRKRKRNIVFYLVDRVHDGWKVVLRHLTRNHMFILWYICNIKVNSHLSP